MQTLLTRFFANADRLGARRNAINVIRFGVSTTTTPR